MTHADQPISDALLRRASLLSSASLHEAGGKIGALPSSLRPLDVTQRLCGRAFPVACPPGDNLFLHHAIYVAEPGDVLVVKVTEGEHGYWGEIMAEAARSRGIAGLVITGGVRDSLRMVEIGFPVFSERVCIRGTAKNPRAPGDIGAPIRIGDVIIERGDLVLGDADGIVVIPRSRADEVVTAATRREQEEAEIIKRLKAGQTTLSIYNLPDLASDRPPAQRQARRSIHVEGLQHGNLPIPTASRIGRVIATGGVRGVDPVTREMPASVEAQAELMFANLRRIVEASGGRCEDILKVTIWVATPEGRAAVNKPWLEMFPDPDSRPARHIINYALPAGMLVQCEALAVLES